VFSYRPKSAEATPRRPKRVSGSPFAVKAAIARLESASVAQLCLQPLGEAGGVAPEPHRVALNGRAIDTEDATRVLIGG